jgi:hypothetical protein
MSEAFFSTLSPATIGHRNWLMRCQLRKKEGVADRSYGVLDTAMVETAVYALERLQLIRKTGMFRCPFPLSSSRDSCLPASMIVHRRMRL